MAASVDARRIVALSTERFDKKLLNRACGRLTMGGGEASVVEKSCASHLCLAVGEEEPKRIAELVHAGRQRLLEIRVGGQGGKSRGE